jgi:putative N6-adenine-specific DNA methylase
LAYQLFSPCPDELKELLAAEVSALGATNVHTGYSVVYFEATEEVAYRAHLCLRLAGRLCRVLKEIPAQSPRIVFDKARRIRFDTLFASETPISINVTAGSAGKRIEPHLIGSKLREAINDCFEHHQKVKPNQSSYKAPIGVNGHFDKNRLLVSLDTCNESLHRRGFREEGHPAPLKETLAAACLAVCEYDGTVPFYDPMCGSGTIVVEAAMMAINRAPLINRPEGGFGFEHLKDFDAELWRSVKEQARRAERPLGTTIHASDMDAGFLQVARKTAANAGLEDIIRFSNQDFFKTQKPQESGLLVMNIPYNVRMEEKGIDGEYLVSIGEHFKNHYQGWRCAVLAPSDSPLKSIRLKPGKKVRFLNGTVPVTLLVFDIY